MDSSLNVSKIFPVVFRKLQSLIHGSRKNHQSSSSSSAHNHYVNDHTNNQANHEERSRGGKKPKSPHDKTNKVPQEPKHIRIIKPRLDHLKNSQNMGCFKDIILACTPSKRTQIAPQLSPSPSPSPLGLSGPTTPVTDPKPEPVSPVEMTCNLSEFELGVDENKDGVKQLHRAASMGRTTSMGSRDCKAQDFAAKKTMSNKDFRRNDSYTETPRYQRSTSRNHIVFSNSSGLLKPVQLEYMLECTLQELCFGCVKQIKVSRIVVTSTGSMSKEEELLTVNVKPGWTKGTKITFPGEEDSETGSQSGDIVFVVKEREHKRLRRQDENEEDLEVEIGLPLEDAIIGCSLSVPLIDGGQIILFGDDIIEPGFERVIQGQGMPRKKDPSLRGDLKIKFQVDFPKIFTDSQRSEISKILSESDSLGLVPVPPL